MTGTPAAEFEIDEGLVRRLLTAQEPALAHLPLLLVDSGFDNVMMRVGDELVVRLPRRASAVALIEHEQRVLPHLGRRLPLPIPMPVFAGRPGEGYPWPWSIVPWIAGRTADLEEPEPHQAEVFAHFLRALHELAPADAPVNALRGVPLEARRADFEPRLSRVEASTDWVTSQLRAHWQLAIDADVHTEARWIHGDLHARNVIVGDGALCGVIDWGDVTGGDVATDLASIYMLFGAPEARARAFSAYGPMDDATWHRARAGPSPWAPCCSRPEGLITRSTHSWANAPCAACSKTTESLEGEAPTWPSSVWITSISAFRTWTGRRSSTTK